TLVTEAKQKVETGTKVAHQCAEIFDEVVNSVNSVNVMIDEISNASREQSQGISEIAKAMNQLDEATHENATTSQESAQSSDLLRQRANSVNAIVTNLNSMVEGGEVSAVTPAAVAVTPTATVLAFEKRTDKKTKSLAKQTSTGGKTHSAPMKKAVGAEDMPSGDDPRFEDL
ncbi:MAG: hypothetical protein JST16_03970, partial [Bdellovibrionales bacterium]|nr:hypothetical protein [Bdellovibrionales bacterium]